MSVRSDRAATLPALAIAGLVVAISIRFSTFVAWGTDSATYIAAADRWAAADLFSPSSFHLWAGWAAGGLPEAPFGLVPGPTRGTLTPMYPLGYPLLVAAARVVGGPLAPYVVAPLFAGVLCWCLYRLGRDLAGPAAGIAASLLAATSPVVLANTMTPMSDVPATALVAAAWVLSLRPGTLAAVAAGLTTAMAIAVRPNLAPAAVALAGVVLLADDRRRWARMLAFAGAAALGPALILWSQAALYGGAFTPGYLGADQFFRAERIPINLRHYPRMLVDLHSWLAPAGLLLMPVLLLTEPPGPTRARRWLIVAGAVGVIAANVAVYLPYLTFDGWYWLRFLLPALCALFLLLAGAVDAIRQRLRPRLGPLAAAALLPLAIVPFASRHETIGLFVESPRYRRVELMGRYLATAIPDNAVVLTYLQSAAVSFHTGRPVVRLDTLPADLLDQVVRDLWRRGYRPVFVLDEAMEGEGFRQRFQTSLYGRLDWPRRAEFLSPTAVWYLDPDDRERFRSGARWPTDVLTWPVRSLPDHPPPAPADDGPMFPPARDTLAFKRTLERVYREQLARPAAESRVPADRAGSALQHYLLSRGHGCPHDDAVRLALADLDGRARAALCRGDWSGFFPPHDDLADFRRRLEDVFAGRGTAPDTTYVDHAGDAIWMTEYFRHRIDGCTHPEASRRVIGLIGGDPPGSVACRMQAIRSPLNPQ